MALEQVGVLFFDPVVGHGLALGVGKLGVLAHVGDDRLVGVLAQGHGLGHAPQPGDIDMGVAHQVDAEFLQVGLDGGGQAQRAFEGSLDLGPVARCQRLLVQGGDGAVEGDIEPRQFFPGHPALVRDVVGLAGEGEALQLGVEQDVGQLEGLQPLAQLGQGGCGGREGRLRRIQGEPAPIVGGGPAPALGPVGGALGDKAAVLNDDLQHVRRGIGPGRQRHVAGQFDGRAVFAVQLGLLQLTAVQEERHQNQAAGAHRGLQASGAFPPLSSRQKRAAPGNWPAGGSSRPQWSARACMSPNGCRRPTAPNSTSLESRAFSRAASFSRPFRRRGAAPGCLSLSPPERLLFFFIPYSFVENTILMRFASIVKKEQGLASDECAVTGRDLSLEDAPLL